MKTKIKTIIIATMLIGFSLPACQKYEEGPCISFRSAKTRLYGAYHIKEYTVDGIDSLSLFNDSLCLIISFFYDDINYVDICQMNDKRKDGKYVLLFWQWRLSDDNMNLIIDETNGTTIGTGPFGINKKPTWEFLKLSNKKIKMKTIYNDKEYIFYMEDDF